MLKINKEVHCPNCYEIRDYNISIPENMRAGIEYLDCPSCGEEFEIKIIINVKIETSSINNKDLGNHSHKNS